jgi:uncharacterized Fe-S cluster-containing MiaB family protein
MLSLNPNSVQTMRRYAYFLDEVGLAWLRNSRGSSTSIYYCECVECQVANNPAKARKMNQQADDIEDAQSKEHADLSAAVTIFATGSALDPSREDVRNKRQLILSFSFEWNATYHMFAGGCDHDWAIDGRLRNHSVCEPHR